MEARSTDSATVPRSSLSHLSEALAATVVEQRRSRPAEACLAVPKVQSAEPDGEASPVSASSVVPGEPVWTLQSLLQGEGKSGWR